MSAIVNLVPVIEIDKDRCNNCYACITACPVKYCLNGSEEKLLINHDVCIGCGHCIAVCTRKARLPVDDSKHFFSSLKCGDKIVAVAAPAVVSAFPDNYLKLNGYLKSLGVEAVFDVSFGAELTVVSYLDYIKRTNPKLVIAQPCPAIVNYIEIYCPQLIPYLAPADSPILHTIKMIKEFYPQYKNHKVAVISPCLAKKREFAATGFGDYNVTILALKKALEKENVNLQNCQSVAYTGPAAERAVSFPAPGGLLDTVERFMPGIRRNTRKIEGVHAIYPYLWGMANNLDKPGIEFPLLIDCLNCEMGCIGGPGIENDNSKTLDELETPVRKRSRELEKQLNPQKRERLYRKYHKLLENYWRPGLYDRKYQNLSANFSLKRPNDKELNNIYRNLKKTNEEDLYDCTACGYGSCRRMATAIFNKLNKPDNCAQYNLALLEEERKNVKYINQHFKVRIDRALQALGRLDNLVEKVNNSIKIQSESVEESTAGTEKMVNSLKSTSTLSQQKREVIIGLIDNAERGQNAMQEMVAAVKEISTSVDGIASAIKIISVIASNTNLLAMNAAIEAARAGTAGTGFAVVADEIRRLSESTRENSRNIAQTLSNIIGGINTTAKRTGDTGELISDMSGKISGFAETMTEIIDSLSKLSAESSGITNSLNILRENSSVVKKDYGEMLSLSDILRGEINNLSKMSADIVRAIEENNQEIIAALVSEEAAKHQ